MKSISEKQAFQSLEQIARTQQVIKSNSVKEYMPWFAWSLFVLISYPTFDYVRGHAWLPFVIMLFIAGEVITFRYYKQKSKQIHQYSYTPPVAALWSSALISLSVFMASLFSSKFAYTWTVTGISLAAILFGYGLHLKSKHPL